MKYDFTTVLDRKGTGSAKWNGMYMEKKDVADGTVPMSTADMEFANAPEIREGLSEFALKAVYGYTEATQAYTEAVVDWQKKRHGFEVEQEWIVQTQGVIPGLAQMIQAYTKPGDGIIIMTPVYFPFRITTVLAGRKVVENPLKLTDAGYEMDYEDLEKKAADERTTLMIFCSPHNPVGRVWTREELERMMDICIRHGVFVLDDEIHNDLIMPGYTHTVLAAISPEARMNCAVCTAPSKSFNLAGLQTSNIIIADPVKRALLMAEKIKGFSNYLNIFGYEACRLAYTKGEPWLDECIQVIDENAKYVREYMAQELPEVRVFPLEGTYLLWADFRALGLNHEELKRLMVEDADIFLDEGFLFGKQARGFERFNIACPTSVVKDAMKRIVTAVKKKKEEWNVSGAPVHFDLKEGMEMPDFVYDTPFESGKSLLADIKASGKKTVLIFSRYVTCLFCQKTIEDLAANYDKIVAKNAQVKIVLQSTPDRIKDTLGDINPFPFEFICDADQKLYSRYNVTSADMLSLMFSPNISELMVQMASKPQTDEEPEGNPMQLPATFIIGTDGKIRYADYAETMDGVPDVEELSERL